MRIVWFEPSSVHFPFLRCLWKCFWAVQQQSWCPPVTRVSRQLPKQARLLLEILDCSRVQLQYGISDIWPWEWWPMLIWLCWAHWAKWQRSSNKVITCQCLPWQRNENCHSFTHCSLEKLCGEQLPFTFNSSGKVVSLRLHTDSDVQESGFNATYSTMDSKELNSHAKLVLLLPCQQVTPHELDLATGRGISFNECLLNNGSCTSGDHENGTAQNSGSSCPHGYQLAADNVSCTGLYSSS